MEPALLVFGFVVYLGCIVVLGKICELTDETPVVRLSRRPNVRRVRRDPEQAA